LLHVPVKLYVKQYGFDLFIFSNNIVLHLGVDLVGFLGAIAHNWAVLDRQVCKRLTQTSSPGRLNKTCVVHGILHHLPFGYEFLKNLGHFSKYS